MKPFLGKVKSSIKFRLWKNFISFQPVFLIGCGRSGTTILGETLGRHSGITFLKEKRDLWHQAYPELDIWSDNAPHPKLVARKSDHQHAKTRILRSLFHRKQVLNNGSILLEKLPINAFRLNFINAAFPDAKFIYLHRNGLEVAYSIARMAENGNWFGQNNRKWKLLEELLPASNRKGYSTFDKCFIEWQLSMSYSEDFFSNLDSNRCYKLSYQSLVENPSYHIENLFRFLNLKSDNDFVNNITQGIKRQRKQIIARPEDYFDDSILPIQKAGNNLTNQSNG